MAPTRTQGTIESIDIRKAVGSLAVEVEDGTMYRIVADGNPLGEILIGRNGRTLKAARFGAETFDAVPDPVLAVGLELKVAVGDGLVVRAGVVTGIAYQPVEPADLPASTSSDPVATDELTQEQVKARVEALLYDYYTDRDRWVWWRRPHIELSKLMPVQPTESSPRAYPLWMLEHGEGARLLEIMRRYYHPDHADNP